VLDRACLQLCIALLDHTLKGDHFESVVLSFLAVLGIDENPGGVFRGPISHSPDLSKFIKMAQMLVVQRSVFAAEDSEVEHPSDMLGEIRERFMVRGSRTAFDWACRLRSYAKNVVSNTTSLGYITWSEDGGSVTYKDTGFSMDALRKFISVQLSPLHTTSRTRLEVAANMHGCLKMSIRSDAMSISSVWTDLNNPELDPGHVTGGECNGLSPRSHD
jgi:hypothetical protein